MFKRTVKKRLEINPIKSASRAIMVIGLIVPFVDTNAGETAVFAQPMVTMGWLESVYIKPWGLKVTAKLDTGAKTSSIHASVIEHFRKNDDDWVKFDLIDQDAGKKITVEKPLIRTAYIKERKAGASKRDVVMMSLCKNGKVHDTEMTLVDRSNFNYPLLLGRSFLKGVAYVDSGATFLYPGDDDACNSNKSNK